MTGLKPRFTVALVQQAPVFPSARQRQPPDGG